jgi:hypothetical protein
VFFRDRVTRTICPDWLQTMILLIAASWVARIAGVSHQRPAYGFFKTFFFCYYCAQSTLWHLQKFWQYIKYVILEFSPLIFYFIKKTLNSWHIKIVHIYGIYWDVYFMYMHQRVCSFFLKRIPTTLDQGQTQQGDWTLSTW